jgi:hypothetical protein
MTGGGGALAATYAAITAAPGAEGSIRELERDAFEAAAAADGWIRGDHLLADDADAFARLRASAVAFTGEVDAKTIGMAMAWAAGPLLAVPLAVYVTAARVPGLTLSDLAFRPHGTEAEAVVVRPVTFACLADDPAAADPMARVVPDAAALRERFVAVVEGLIAPVIDAVSARTTIARPAVWGLAAGTVAYELAEGAVPHAGLDAAVAQATATVAAGPRLGRRLPELFVFDAPGGPWFGLRGAACCRANRWKGREGELCLSCPLRDDESRLVGLRAWREGLAEAVEVSG